MKNSYLSERFCELKNDFKKQINIADIWDRLAAFIFDFLFLILISNLIFSPIKKNMERAILNEHDGAVQVHFIMILFGFCMLFVLYHTLCIFFFRKTFGKKIFSLEVKSIAQNEKLSFANCILRSFVQLLSLAMVGFPFLQVLAHRLRRPLHDRASDSVVCSLRKKGKAPDFIEKLWVKVVYATVIINFSFIVLATVYFFKNGTNSMMDLVTTQDNLCDAVSEASADWPNNYLQSSVEQKKMTRLDIALTLFGAGEIDKNCLDVEASRYLSFEENMGKAYLAKAFVHENQDQISNNYLKKVCELNKNSESCALTKMIDAWSKKNWQGVDDLAKSKKEWSPFVVVWLIRHFDRKQDFKKVIELAESLSPNKFLVDFLGKYKSIALWNLNRKDEAEQLFESSYAVMEKENQEDFLSAMCRLEVDESCDDTRAKACKLLNNEMLFGNLDYQAPAVLSLVKSEKCGIAKINNIIDKYRNKIDDPSMQLYLAASKAVVSGKKSVAIQIYKNLLDTKDMDSYFAYEVRSNLLDLAGGKKASENAAVWWLQADTFNKYHLSFGQKILNELMEKKMWAEALKVSQKIMNSQYLTQDLQKRLAIVFFKNKKYTMAKNLIAKINSQEQDNSKRGLASVDEFQEVSRLLKEKK